MNFALTSKDYLKIKERYLNYLKTYRSLNNGSDDGATTLNQFYIFWTYTLRYNSVKKRMPIDIK
jgi:hypothetical protein